MKSYGGRALGPSLQHPIAAPCEGRGLAHPQAKAQRRLLGARPSYLQDTVEALRFLQPPDRILHLLRESGVQIALQKHRLAEDDFHASGPRPLR
jgi:hypothetical protein